MPRTAANRPSGAWIRGLVLALLAALALAQADPAAAGAWPRDRGTGFLSSATRVSAPAWSGPGWTGQLNLYSTLYGEYGLGRRLTAGFDIGHGISGKGKAIFFLRKSLPPRSGGSVYALELGLGQIAGQPAVRPGLSWGRGISRRNGGSGWLSLESVAEIRLDTGHTDFKADFTLGLNHGARFKSILQLQTGVSQGDPSFIRAAPSLVVKAGVKSHIELGVTAGIVGDDSYGVKLGLWRDF